MTFYKNIRTTIFTYYKVSFLLFIFNKYKEFRMSVTKIKNPPMSVVVTGISSKNSHTQIGAIIVSIIIKRLTSLAGRLLVPIPRKTLAIGVVMRPANKSIYKVCVSRCKSFTRIKEIKATKNPAREVTANLLISLYLANNTNDNENNRTQHKA